MAKNFMLIRFTPAERPSLKSHKNPMYILDIEHSDYSKARDGNAVRRTGATIDALARTCAEENLLGEDFTVTTLPAPRVNEMGRVLTYVNEEEILHFIRTYNMHIRNKK